MTISVEVIIVGENPHVADQVLHELRRADFTPAWTQVSTEQAFRDQLDGSGDAIDLIVVANPDDPIGVSDALRLLRERQLDIPLVVITDAVNLESAVEYMRQGVADCVTGDQMSRLGSIAVRELNRRRHQPSMERERSALGVLAHIVEQSPVAIAITDLHANIEYVNPKFTQLTGYAYDEAIGMSADRLAAGRPDTALKRQILDALMSVGEWHGQFHNRKKTGEVYWASASISSVRNAAGDTTHFVAMYEDITERVHVAQALRASEERFRALIEASPLAIVGLDVHGIVRTWKPAATDMMGWTSEEAIGYPYGDLAVPVEAQEEYHTLRDRVMQGEGFTNAQVRRQRKDGTLFDASLSTAPLRDADNNIVGIMAMIADVTEHKQIGERLRQSEERFRRLIENSSDVLAILDIEAGTIMYQGPSTERILGYAPADMVGQKVFSFVHPNDLAQIGEVFNSLLERPRLPVKADARFRRKDSSWIHLEAIGKYAPELGGVVVNAWDITERKGAEEAIRALNADLERRVAERTHELAEANERLQELDRLKSKFVSDVSHDLRAPLANMHLHLDLLERGKPEKRGQYVGVLKAQVNHLIDLIEDILDLSRLERERETARFERIDLNAVVEQVITANRPRAEATGLELIFEPDVNLPPIRGVRDQLARLIANLTTNAINYTSEGHVRVSTFSEDGHVCLRVEDTGIGIDPDDLPHVLDRFYRGRRARQSDVPGTGLGLGIVKEIAALHEGDVQVESRVGEGSTFTVLLPAAPEEAGPA